MDENKMSPQQLGEQMQAICCGTLSGEKAAEVLRVAVQFYNEGKEGLAALENAVRRAEEVLAYGPMGRPSQFFGEAWGSLSGRVYADSEIVKIFSMPSAAMLREKINNPA